MCFFILFICADFSAYATADIDADATTATCDESVLNASNGTANLEINWEPNVIPLRWYSGNTEIHPENTNANSCTYDGALNIPATPPEREGYNFAGWKIRPTYDFSKLAPSGVYALTDTDQRYTKRVYGRQGCVYNGNIHTNIPCTDPEFDELSNDEWKIKFNTGTLYGNAICGSTIGAAGAINNTLLSKVNDIKVYRSHQDVNNVVKQLASIILRTTGKTKEDVCKIFELTWAYLFAVKDLRTIRQKYNIEHSPLEQQELE